LNSNEITLNCRDVIEEHLGKDFRES